MNQLNNIVAIIKRKIRTFVKNPSVLLIKAINSRLFRLLPDKQFIKLQYRIVCKRKLNLGGPCMYAEKLQ